MGVDEDGIGGTAQLLDPIEKPIIRPTCHVAEAEGPDHPGPARGPQILERLVAVELDDPQADPAGDGRRPRPAGD